MNDKNTIQNLPKGSEPSEKDYGCIVCENNSECEYNPFGTCEKFKRRKNND